MASPRALVKSIPGLHPFSEIAISEIEVPEAETCCDLPVIGALTVTAVPLFRKIVASGTGSQAKIDKGNAQRHGWRTMLGSQQVRGL